MGLIAGSTADVRPLLGTLTHRSDRPRIVTTAFGPVAAASCSDAWAEDGRGALVLAGRAHRMGLDGSLTARELLDAHRAGGPSAFDDLGGAFVLAVTDGSDLLLVRDGAGARTVYWTETPGGIAFANEPKGLWSGVMPSPRLHAPGLARYLAFSFQPGLETLLEGLHELPPGHRLSWSPNHGSRLERWFDFECRAARLREQNESLTDADWVAMLRAEILQAVHRMAPANEEVLTATLSGGIDSSVVVAALRTAFPNRPLRTFSLHFGEHYPNELEPARAVAEALGTDHVEHAIRPRDFTRHFDRVAWHLDDPIGDPVTVPNFEVARAIGSAARTVFNGEGGDPLFGGPKNLPMLLAHHYARRDLGEGWRERMYVASFQRALDEIDEVLLPEWRERIDPARDLEAIIRPFLEATEPASLLGKLQAMNMRLKGAHLILPKVERLFAAHGLAPASPLFTPELMILAQAMPERLRLHHGVEKVALKHAFADRLPPTIAARKKSGMRVPVRYWMRGEMYRFARRLLSPAAVEAAGVFRARRVRELFREARSRRPGRSGLRLWMLLTFEAWRRQVLGDHRELGELPVADLKRSVADG